MADVVPRIDDLIRNRSVRECALRWWDAPRRFGRALDRLYDVPVTIGEAAFMACGWCVCMPFSWVLALIAHGRNTTLDLLGVFCMCPCVSPDTIDVELV
jgi:hypothetical protein